MTSPDLAYSDLAHHDRADVVADFQGDASLGALLEALVPHRGKSLVIEYGDRVVRPGYHVTEVKAGSFVTLDCGGNPDAWRETVLQIEDLGPEGATDFMGIAKFEGILGKVAARVSLDPGARVTIEIGVPGEPMQIFDLGRLRSTGDNLHLDLVPRAAICKPRHREEMARPGTAAACCGSSAVPQATGKACCSA